MLPQTQYSRLLLPLSDLPPLSVIGVSPVVLHGTPGLDLAHVTRGLGGDQAGLGPVGGDAPARLGAVTWDMICMFHNILDL